MVADALWERDDLVLRDRCELPHAAPGVREPDACHRRAEVLQPTAAVRAPAAVRERHDRHAVALAHARHAGADSDHVAGELVPEDLRILRTRERMRLDGGHDRACRVLVQVRAADAARRDAHDDLAVAGIGRLGHVLDAEVPGSMEAKSSHGTIRSSRRRAKSSVNDDSLSRTPKNPSLRLRPMSVNVSIVRPRSASVCHHEASRSTFVSRSP